MGIFDKVKEIESNSIKTGKETGNEETSKRKITEDIIYFYDKKLSKKDIAKYIQKVRDFLNLLSK